jgi:hypothetical protein
MLAPAARPRASDALNPRYAICRLDVGRYWLADGVWTERLQQARTFAFVTEAVMSGLLDCPLPVQAWRVVPIKP